MTRLKCTNNQIKMRDILLKIKEIQLRIKYFESCCTESSIGEDMRCLRSGNRLYMTNTGVDPVIVPTPTPRPLNVHTYMDGTMLSRIVFNRVAIREVYFNGSIVLYTDGDIF